MTDCDTNKVECDNRSVIEATATNDEHLQSEGSPMENAIPKMVETQADSLGKEMQNDISYGMQKLCKGDKKKYSDALCYKN